MSLPDDDGHEKQFWNAIRRWSEEVRNHGFSAQALKVAWALSNTFGISHGIAYRGRDTLGASAGVADPSDVRKALRLLEKSGFIHQVTAEELRHAMEMDAPAALRRKDGRKPNGYCMVLDERGETFVDSVENIIRRTSRSAVKVQRKPIDESRLATLRETRTKKEQLRVSGDASLAVSGDGALPKMIEAEGSGAKAPAAPIFNTEQSMETRTPEGARLSNPDDRRSVLSNQEALDELVSAYAGTVGDRQLAFSAMMMAIEEGAFHEQLLHLVTHQGDTDEPLDEFLWRQTEKGRRELDRAARRYPPRWP